MLTEPKEIYFENRGGNRTRTTEYPATKKDWYALTAMLEDMEIFKLDGYNVDGFLVVVVLCLGFEGLAGFEGFVGLRGVKRGSRG